MECHATTGEFYHWNKSKKRNGESYVNRANPDAMDRLASSTSNGFYENQEINPLGPITQASRP
jgi:hypothetical protein